MGIRDLFRLTALLKRTAKVPDQPLVDKRFTERREQTTPGGLVFDLMEPARAPEGLVISVHGSTIKGKDDARLQHFARSLAIAGGTCAVPTLPGISDMRWVDSDIDSLVELIEHLHAQTGRRVGLIGFSSAGSYALLAAARKSVADKVRFVLSIGAYHSLNRVYDHFFETRHQDPIGETAWNDRIYLHLTTAHRQRKRLNLPDEVQAGVVSLLKRFCYQAEHGEKRAFFEQHLQPLDLLEVEHQHQDRAMLDAVSPAGQLQSLSCQVGLVHDPADGIVQVEHAIRLTAELPATAGAADHRLLVTSLMKHVDLSDALNMREIYRLFQILAPLVRPDPHS
jgi:hypothetical protein